jgi:hypothetical protein
MRQRCSGFRLPSSSCSGLSGLFSSCLLCESPPRSDKAAGRTRFLHFFWPGEKILTASISIRSVLVGIVEHSVHDFLLKGARQYISFILLCIVGIERILKLSSVEKAKPAAGSRVLSTNLPRTTRTFSTSCAGHTFEASPHHQPSRIQLRARRKGNEVHGWHRPAFELISCKALIAFATSKHPTAQTKECIAGRRVWAPPSGSCPHQLLPAGHLATHHSPRFSR